MDKPLPNNIEAEQAVIGACMMSHEALVQVLGIVKPEMFYRLQHQEIFRAIDSMDMQGKNVDLVTLSEELRSAGSLAKLGGATYLSQCLQSVATIVHADHYAGIVREKWLRRELFKAAQDIANFALDEDGDFGQQQARAENLVYQVGQEKPTTAEWFGQVITSRWQELYESRNDPNVAGLQTGFVDLDNALGGLQPGDLVVLAARPGQGKTALAQQMATNVARAGIPVVIYSLEMSKTALADRGVCAAAGIDSYLLRSRKLGIDKWLTGLEQSKKLGGLPIWIDDDPDLTTLEIRSRTRRLKLEQDIGLIVIDHLQQISERMERGQNKNDLVGAMTKRLKAMAKELNVPVILLSQMNRTAEGQKPNMAMLRDCLAGDAKVVNAETGENVPVREIAEQGLRFDVWALDDDWKLVRRPIMDAWSVGVQEVFKVTTRTGRALRCTGGHRLLTDGGWRQLRDISVGERIVLPREYPEVTVEASMRRWAHSDVLWDEVADIRPNGKEPVYDVTVGDLHNFCVDGFITHNSGEIEAQADVILFIYQPEPQAKFRDILVGKSRNGPVGKVQLSFEREYTRFADLSRRDANVV